ncbi:MAG TPA: PqqD family protein [Actinobacteria bacterium]|nr:PqqD family protein [Actinomycetota bacterium]
MITLENCFQKSDKVPWRIIEGEAILVGVEQGEVIHLNDTAAEIWNAIDEKNTVKDIVNHILDEFEVEKEEAEKDVLELLDKLLEKGVIEPK